MNKHDQLPLFVSSKPHFHDEFENGLFAHPSTTGHLLGDSKLNYEIEYECDFRISNQ